MWLVRCKIILIYINKISILPNKLKSFAYNLLMQDDDLKEIKNLLSEIHKTLKLVFILIAIFALLYFGLLIIFIK